MVEFSYFKRALLAACESKQSELIQKIIQYHTAFAMQIFIRVLFDICFGPDTWLGVMKCTRQIAFLLAGSEIILLLFHGVLHQLRDQARDKTENILQVRTGKWITRLQQETSFIPRNFCKTVNNT